MTSAGALPMAYSSQAGSPGPVQFQFTRVLERDLLRQFHQGHAPRARRIAAKDFQFDYFSLPVYRLPSTPDASE